MIELNRPLIKEVIIENFMSYKYARIPLKTGLNIVTGPNGSGKSSMLLAISVALGLTYTERGRKLSDLIRRGEDVARVTIVFDNTPRNGRRPIPRMRTDEVYLTRYLRIDGNYWHELNHRIISKMEASRLLARIGLNPENMLIIMHQNMVEEFAFLSPTERLQLIEEATGLRGYRAKILSSMKKLESVISQEKEIKEALLKTSEVLNYWKERYDRFIKKIKLEEVLRLLSLERAWRIVYEREVELKELAEKIKSYKLKLSELADNEKNLELEIKEIKNVLSDLTDKIIKGNIDLKEGLLNLNKTWSHYAELYSEKKVIMFKKEILEERIKELKNKERRLKKRYQEALDEAEVLGERIETKRELHEIEKEIKKIELEYASVKDATEEDAETYKKYLNSLKELEERAKIVVENRKRAEEELEKRKSIWRSKITELISSVNKLYKEFIGRLNGHGYLRLINIDDIEKAGLEIYVGFKGTSPVRLDPYTHSGGERSAAIMCFLLALQKHIKSPFRAVDEFDIHMDNVNREIILELLAEMASEDQNIQYIVITPRLLTKLESVSNIIFVQKVKGISYIGVSSK